MDTRRMVPPLAIVAFAFAVGVGASARSSSFEPHHRLPGASSATIGMPQVIVATELLADEDELVDAYLKSAESWGKRSVEEASRAVDLAERARLAAKKCSLAEFETDMTEMHQAKEEAEKLLRIATHALDSANYLAPFDPRVNAVRPQIGDFTETVHEKLNSANDIFRLAEDAITECRKKGSMTRKQWKILSQEIIDTVKGWELYLTPFAKATRSAAPEITPTPTPPTPTPIPARPVNPRGSYYSPINLDPGFEVVAVPSISPEPVSNGTAATTTDFTPNSTSANSEVLVSAVEPGQPQGSTSELVDVVLVDNTGKDHAYQTHTDKQGHIPPFVPAISSLVPPIVEMIVSHRRPDGTWTSGSTTMITDNPPTLVGSQPCEGVPSSGTAITNASSVVDTHGTGSAVLEYQTRATNATSQVLVNGTTKGVITEAASDQSVVAVANGLPPGPIEVAIQTNGHVTNKIIQALVSTHFAPMAPMHAGQTAEVTEFIDGLGSLPGLVHMTINGAATFADGSTSKWLRVKDGRITEAVRAAAHAGAFHIVATVFAGTDTFALPPESE